MPSATNQRSAAPNRLAQTSRAMTWARAASSGLSSGSRSGWMSKATTVRCVLACHVLPVQMSHRKDGEPVWFLVLTGGMPCEVERCARRRLGKVARWKMGEVCWPYVTHVCTCMQRRSMALRCPPQFGYLSSRESVKMR